MVVSIPRIVNAASPRVSDRNSRLWYIISVRRAIPADSRVNTDGRFLKKEQLTDSKIHQIQALNEIAKQRGESLAQMALKWVLKDEVVTSVLIGASRPQQILDNIKVIESAGFTEEELRLIDEVSVEKKA